MPSNFFQSLSDSRFGVSIYSTTPGNTYGSKSGTSMAMPHVAGAAALAWSYALDANYPQIRDALFAGVDPLPSLSGKVATGGRLNLNNTLAQLLQNAASTPPAYLAASTPYEALDLVAGGAGVTTVLDGADDGSAAINGMAEASNNMSQQIEP